MSWREELEQLDAQLAEGRIDPQEHRRRAEDLLAGASGPTPSAPTWRSQSPKQFAERDTQRLRPPWERRPAVTQPEPQAVPPASQPEQDPTPGRAAATPGAEHPVPAERAAQPQRHERATDPGRTDRPAAQPPPPPGTPEPQATATPPESGTPPESMPPRAPEPTWPPVAPAPWQKAANYHRSQAGGPLHGQQNPADRYLAAQQQPARPPGKLRSSRKLLPAILGGGLLVLLVIALVVWLVAFRTDTARSGSARPEQTLPVSSAASTATTGPAKVPESLASRLPALPGNPVHAKDTQPLTSIVQDGYYSEQIAEAISKAGPKSMLVRQSVRDGDELYLLAVIPNTSPRNCQASAAAINDFQRDIGLTDAKHDVLGANTSMLTRAGKQGVYYRTVYCSARMTVITAGASAHRKSAANLRQRFTHFGKSIQGVLPPN